MRWLWAAIGVALFSQASLAQTVPTDAMSALLRQAAFWSSRQPDQARTSLLRALRIDPANADALAALVDLEASLGHREAATSAWQRLPADDPRTARLSSVIRIGAIDADALTLARKFALAGQWPQAVAEYDRIFLGNSPPARLAIEYFRAVAATPSGWEAARDGLAALVREQPANLDAQLAYAEGLTGGARARLEGIERLQALALNPPVAYRAATAWRAALRRLPDTPEAVGPLLAYVAQHPDADLTAKLALDRSAAPPVQAVSWSLPRRAPVMRPSLAQTYLAARRPRDAAATAEAALQRNPSDVDVRQVAVEAALSVGDQAHAEALVRDGMRLSPMDPQVWRASADLARARGDKQAALSALERARALRATQLDDGAPATVLALLTPPELAPQVDVERDEDGDQVTVRRRVLDTDATDLPPPLRGGGQAAPPPLRPVVDTRPPLPLYIGASDLGPVVDPGTPAGAADPMTARIDSDIAAVSDRPDPSAQASVGFRGRSGHAGTSQLAEITVPLEAGFAVGETSQIKLAVTPTFLGAGAGQTASGAALDAAFSTPDLSADIGSTPLGFQQQNVVGGLEWVPTLSQDVRLRLTGERRAVTDSLLSYAGVKDPSGESFGGVTYARGHANLEFDVGPAELYVGGGGGVLDGKNVQNNSEAEAGAGGSVPVWQDPGQELRAGLDLVYYGFSKDLSGFTPGEGGYFSPQSYFAALFPLTYKGQAGGVSYEIGGSAGVQTYRDDDHSSNQTGFTGGAHGSLDYQMAAALHIGLKADYEHTGNFNQTLALLYARYIFGGR